MPATNSNKRNEKTCLTWNGLLKPRTKICIQHVHTLSAPNQKSVNCPLKSAPHGINSTQKWTTVKITSTRFVHPKSVTPKLQRQCPSHQRFAPMQYVPMFAATPTSFVQWRVARFVRTHSSVAHLTPTPAQKAQRPFRRDFLQRSSRN